MSFPAIGMAPAEILSALHRFKMTDLDWRHGRVWAYVYQPDEAATDLMQQAYLYYLTENCLDPTTFPSTAHLEQEVVRMVADLLGGDEETCGNVTAGGTESILLAVKTARDWASHQRPAIKQPEMVLARTAHAAFHKAAHYLGVKPVVVDFDPVTFAADVAAMRAAINERTIMLVASAPSYAQGALDPVADIAALAQEHGLLCHVDACVGGMYLPFLRQLGREIPPFDLSVPGVTSLSVDLHKYGYAAKGASVILYRHRALRRYQLFASTDTTAYTVINPTVLSSRSAGPLAAAWALLRYLGAVGYRQIVAAVQDATDRLIAGIAAIPDLQVLGQPVMSMVAVASPTINVFQLADAMRRRGWYVQPQLSAPHSPRNIHFSVSYGVAGYVDALLADLAACVAEVCHWPPVDRNLVEMAVRALTVDHSPSAVQQLWQAIGLAEGRLPTDMALINEVLDALPDAIANELVIDVFNALF
ncbi:aspartate aminotransferase family protein [Chloroflexus sp.]|uniref:pyridoxal phosphate-dependent decarboxylase family protein n=1 Tax=Chloroflexus sp. TaxID=1904827 RepID=UPI002ADDBB90|nr:aspartate aminotransferase family protein [Chloroflexus sp.]